MGKLGRPAVIRWLGLSMTFGGKGEMALLLLLLATEFTRFAMCEGGPGLAVNVQGRGQRDKGISHEQLRGAIKRKSTEETRKEERK